MNDLVSSKTLRAPPKPASPSATIGTNQSSGRRPSAQAIWSARRRALLMRRTRAGAELAGYSDWSGRPPRRGWRRRPPASPTGRWLEPRLDHLHGLSARHGPQGVDVVGGAGAGPTASRPSPWRGCAPRACCRAARTTSAARVGPARSPPSAGWMPSSLERRGIWFGVWIFLMVVLLSRSARRRAG
jgi:hypothetical protein